MMEDPEGRRGIATADAARLSQPAAAMDRFRVRGFIFSGSGLGTWGGFGEEDGRDADLTVQLFLMPFG
jgi:hypothetical protein